jgi:hypothetical protein
MANKILLSEKLQNILLSSDTLELIKTKGIQDVDSFNDKLIESVNFINTKINVDEVLYLDIKLDTYTGLIKSDEEKLLGYVFIIPPKLGTRSGFLSQQVLGFLSNIIKDTLSSNSYEVSNLPLYVINCDVDEIILSKAINIIGAKILGINYIDLYNRNENDILIDKKGTSTFQTLREYNDLIASDDDNINEYFDIYEENKVVVFKTNKLKDLNEPLTNEPYYFGIKAIPALYLASNEGYDIDVTAFDDWYKTGINKNVKSFYNYALKLKTMEKEVNQKIFYGAPGTGKSYKIDEMLKIENIEKDQIFRVTFHPEFSYSDFIGQLLPTIEDIKGDKTITYSFSKGIFTQSIEKAYEDTSKNVFLILEEMSRGDVAAIFGDIFQLLDREQDGPQKGYSRYFINNDIIAKDISYINDNKIKLPPNLNILGTVNTSDQNVFVMDTAFKRRFDWEYISTKPIKIDKDTYLNNPSLKFIDKDGTSIDTDWVHLYISLNKYIAKKEYLELGEDKQIGQFFIEFTKNETPESLKTKIQNKLLQYLWNDIHKATFKRNISLFSSSISSFSALHELFGDDKNVFSEDFIACLRKDLNT